MKHPAWILAPARNDTARFLLLVVALQTGCLAARAEGELRIPLGNFEPISASRGGGTLGVDRSLTVGKSPLSVNGQQHAEGIAMPVPAELVYDLNGDSQRFESFIGYDDDARTSGRSNIFFRVCGDGREFFNSGALQLGMPPHRVSVDVTGVQQLRLTVTGDGGNSNIGHADWIEPTVSQAEHLPESPPVAYTVRAPGLALGFSADGQMTTATLGKTRSQIRVRGGSYLGGCRTQGKVTAKKLSADAMEFTRTVTNREQRQCVLVERFSPTANSIRWELEIRCDAGLMWTTPVCSELQLAMPELRQFWTAWSDPDQRGDGWHDPLEFRPFRNTSWTYSNIKSAIPTDGDYIVLPLAMSASATSDSALSLILSPEDTLLDLKLATEADGKITFSRTHHRLGESRTLHFAADLVSQPADWRAALGWMTRRYPQYFNPVNPAADAMAGCAAYSGNENPVDAARLKRMAFRVNWKLSDDFAYMGMFLPPLAGPDDRWLRSGDEPRPPGKPDWTSFRRLNDYARQMRGDGFHVLSYFNVTEYGKKMCDTNVPASRRDEPDLWKDPVAFMKLKLPNASFKPPIGTFYDAWAVDVGDPDYQKFMLEQAQRHLDRLPDTSGICIDRLDWLRFYNPAGDDGVSCVEGQPARALSQSWLKFTDQLGPLMHKAGKVIFVNNLVTRLELFKQVDGFYNEYAQTGPALNATAFVAVRKPALGWTADANNLKPDPDDFFQRHLHLGVFPTAPYPNNNHCLNPDPWVDEQYFAYGPLLDALRGKKWVLESHCLEVSGGAKANLFEVPGGWVAPVSFGGTNSVVTLELNNVPGLKKGVRCEALYPGTAAPVLLASAWKNRRLEITVPLLHRCAMVRIQ